MCTRIDRSTVVSLMHGLSRTAWCGRRRLKAMDRLLVGVEVQAEALSFRLKAQGLVERLGAVVCVPLAEPSGRTPPGRH
jgi:hypothetical protein